MKVVFYGCKESLATWKTLVEGVTSKRCEPLKVEQCKYYPRWTFVAHINEEDCVLIMKKLWYVKEEGQDLPWNFRVSFSKHR